MSEPLVTAIVSTWSAERYMRGCLEDLVAQTIGDRLEIIVIDSNSPENEGAIVREFQSLHPNIHYCRTDFREDSTGAFNRAIPLARGKYLSNANTDDRHRPDAFELMVKALDQHPEFGIVYADSLITNVDNETFAHNTARRRYAWPDYTHPVGLSTCLFGPHPLWRREVHDRVGLFSPDHPIANDQDMFLRIAWKFGAVHLRQTLGLFLERPDSNSGANRRRETIEDVMRVMQKYRTAMPLEDIFPLLRQHEGDPHAYATALFEMGNLCALGPYTDLQHALQFYSRALDLTLRQGAAMEELRAPFWNNAACVLHCLGLKQKAFEALDAASELPEAAVNRDSMRRADASRTRLMPMNLSFVEPPHPVVETSRHTRGLEVTESREIVWAKATEQVPWDVYEGPNGRPVSEEERTWTIPRTSKRPPGQRKHIMLVMYGWADSGGGTILPRQVATGFAKRGHRVSVVYAAAKPRPNLPPYGVLREREASVELYGIFNRPSLFMDLEGPEREVDDPQIRQIFERLLDELNPDIVHFYNLHNLGMSLPRSCKDAGIPTVFSSNNYWPVCPRLYLFDGNLDPCEGAGEAGTPCATCLGNSAPAHAHAARAQAAGRLLNEDLDVHLAVSTRVREIYIKNGVQPNKVRVLQQQPASLDQIWETVGTKREVQAPLGSPLRVGFIGSLLPHKGVHILAAALQAFPKGALLGIFHGDVALDYARSLKQIDKNDVIEFGGAYTLPDLPGLLADLDIVVVPSIWEDCAPFVVAEALASRAPVIGSRLGGIPDFIEEGRTGLLFEAGNPNDLAQKLLPFLQDTSLLRRMQAAIQAPRAFQAYLDQLLGVYTGLSVRTPQVQST